MPNIIQSPPCKALYTWCCFDPDRKFCDRSGKGVFSITGNFTQEGKEQLNKQILAVIGEVNAGTYHTKSDGLGGTDIKFKIKEYMKDRQGKDIIQRPTITFQGKPYNDHFEMAEVSIGFTPKHFPAYNKTSLILRKVDIIKLADVNEMSRDEKDEAILNEMDALNGST